MDQHAIMLAGYDKGLKVGIEEGSTKTKNEIAKKAIKTRYIS